MKQVTVFGPEKAGCKLGREPCRGYGRVISKAKFTNPIGLHPNITWVCTATDHSVVITENDAMPLSPLSVTQ